MEHTHELNFDKVLLEYHSGLRVFIRALGVNEVWVDDLAQEVFLIAYRKQPEFNSVTDREQWLRGIARKVVMGDRTKRARRCRLMHEGITDILINLGMEGKESHAVPDDLIFTMKTCVKKLSGSQRSLLDLRYHEGYKSTELAEKLTEKPATIRKKLQRIRDAVRKCMENKLGEISLWI